MLKLAVLPCLISLILFHLSFHLPLDTHVRLQPTPTPFRTPTHSLAPHPQTQTHIQTHRHTHTHTQTHTHPTIKNDHKRQSTALVQLCRAIRLVESANYFYLKNLLTESWLDCLLKRCNFVCKNTCVSIVNSVVYLPSL
jgi:hypothetical protein